MTMVWMPCTVDSRDYQEMVRHAYLGMMAALLGVLGGQIDLEWMVVASKVARVLWASRQRLTLDRNLSSHRESASIDGLDTFVLRHRFPDVSKSFTQCTARLTGCT